MSEGITVILRCQVFLRKDVSEISIYGYDPTSDDYVSDIKAEYIKLF